MEEFFNYLSMKGMKLDEKGKRKLHKYLVGSKNDKISKNSVDSFIENFSQMDKLINSQRVRLKRTISKL